MLEEFVSLGEWWLPNNPEVVVSGKLSFLPNSGATLELSGSFYNSPFEEISQAQNIGVPSDVSSIEDNSNFTSGVMLDFIEPEEIIILGLLNNNEEITLYRCSGRIKSMPFVRGRPTLLFNINYIFRKVHFQNEQAINLKSLSVQYSNLEQWIGKSGIQVSISQVENKIWMSYQPPSKIHLTKIGALDLNITFSQIYINPFNFGTKYYKGNIEQKTYLTIQNPCNQPLDECVDVLLSFADLLSFAMTKPTSVIEITGKVDASYSNPVQQEDGTIIAEDKLLEHEVVILFGLWNSKENSQINLFPHEMLFLFGDVENSLGEVFEMWISKKETYKSVFDLLMTTIYTPNPYLHYGFLNIIQALEAYHTIKHEGMYQDRKVYNKGLYKKFLEALKDFPSESMDRENGISDEFRNALKGKLKSQTRFTLETRLKEILSSASSLLPNNFIGSMEERELFARRASETRNALTHHDKEKREQAAKGQELFQLFDTLTVILQTCLLKELNLPDNAIEILMKRNRQSKAKEWRPSSISNEKYG